MEDARDAWKEVGDRVEALGLKLKLHLDQEQDAEVADRAEGDTNNAFEALSGQVTDAFDAFGNAAKDDAVHADVRELAELIKQALIETFQAVGAEVGEPGIIKKYENNIGPLIDRRLRSFFAGRLRRALLLAAANSEHENQSGRVKKVILIHQLSPKDLKSVQMITSHPDSLVKLKSARL